MPRIYVEDRGLGGRFLMQLTISIALATAVIPRSLQCLLPISTVVYVEFTNLTIFGGRETERWVFEE